MIDDELLKILACPVCKTGVELHNETIVCRQCKRRYPIKNDIPIMLVEEATIDEKNKT